ncbi:hypothetical protein C8R45DRAFT_923692 [Mycena sanguinolenta]|nr:hypothetical protein C8R45DRAFT_923692 [Mycena sanguinolenta]
MPAAKSLSASKIALSLKVEDDRDFLSLESRILGIPLHYLWILNAHRSLEDSYYTELLSFTAQTLCGTVALCERLTEALERADFRQEETAPTPRLDELSRDHACPTITRRLVAGSICIPSPTALNEKGKEAIFVVCGVLAEYLADSPCSRAQAVSSHPHPRSRVHAPLKVVVLAARSTTCDLALESPRRLLGTKMRTSSAGAALVPRAGHVLVEWASHGDEWASHGDHGGRDAPLSGLGRVMDRPHDVWDDRREGRWRVEVRLSSLRRAETASRPPGRRVSLRFHYAPTLEEQGPRLDGATWRRREHDGYIPATASRGCTDPKLHYLCSELADASILVEWFFEGLASDISGGMCILPTSLMLLHYESAVGHLAFDGCAETLFYLGAAIRATPSSRSRARSPLRFPALSENASPLLLSSRCATVTLYATSAVTSVYSTDALRSGESATRRDPRYLPASIMLLRCESAVGNLALDGCAETLLHLCAVTRALSCHDAASCKNTRPFLLLIPISPRPSTDLVVFVVILELRSDAAFDVLGALYPSQRVFATGASVISTVHLVEGSFGWSYPWVAMTPGVARVPTVLVSNLRSGKWIPAPGRDFAQELVRLIIDDVAATGDSRDIGSCGSACRRWLPRSRMHLFSQITLSTSSRATIQKLITSSMPRPPTFYASCAGLGELRIHVRSQMVELDFEHFVLNCVPRFGPSLTRFELYTPADIPLNVVAELISGLPCLTHLRLSGPRYGGRIVDPAAIPSHNGVVYPKIVPPAHTLSPNWRSLDVSLSRRATLLFQWLLSHSEPPIFASLALAGWAANYSYLRRCGFFDLLEASTGSIIVRVKQQE